jgi:hypothetical protein
MPKRIFYTLLIYAGSHQTIAQTPATDSNVQKDSSDLINVYYQSLGEQSPLYNGSEYIEYAFTIQEGHPFFASGTYINGDINFDGMVFHNVPILYDIVKDLVVVQHFQKVYKINLVPEKIDWFTLSGHTFVRLTYDSADQIKTGFYDQLYNGKTALFARREKKILEENVNLQVYRTINSRNFYYIRKEKVYYPIRSLHTLLDVLKTQKKAILQNLKKSKIKFRKNPEQAMLMAVEYYDQLRN